MPQTATIEEKKASFDLTEGREELNLAEFPLIYLGQRVPKGLNKLVFEKQTVDSSSNRTLTKRLEIVATEEHGLAKGADMMVLHALLLIAKQTSNLSSPVVYFSRYQICEIVGWPQNGNSYRRIQEALERWVSVTLFYKAWYDREEDRLKNLQGFHILEDIELNDYDVGRIGRNKQGELPLSSIRFGDRVFQSLNAGNVKKLNLAELFHLKLSLSQRLYSFLDKRFGTRQLQWQFDLRELCTVHLGMSQNYKPSELKRKLTPAIRELVSISFITDVPAIERFERVGHGQYRVTFRRASRDKIVSKPLTGPKTQRLANRQLIKRLTDYGVSANIAQQVVEDPDISQDRIEQKMEMLQWLIDTPSEESPKRPGGWLAKAIKDDWSPPSGFQSKADREAAKHKAEARKKKLKDQEAEYKKQLAVKTADQEKRVADHLATLTDGERFALEREAIAAAPEFLRDRFWKYRDKKPDLEQEAKAMIIHNHVLRLLESSEEKFTLKRAG